MAKIIVGFKCDPELKYDLLEEAESSGITLSKYVESICENRWDTSEEDENYSDEEEQLREQLMNCETRLNHYENVMLGPLFNRHQGKVIDMHLPDGTVVQKEVNHPSDILEIVLNSLKKP